MIRQLQRLPGDWPPAENCHRTDEFPEGHGIIKEVTELRPVPSHPNEDDDDEEIPGQPRFSTQEEKTDAPARNTRSQRRTLTQAVVYSCMDITSTPATPRQLASWKLPMKLLCKIAGAILDASTGELLEYRHLRINPQYRQVWGKSFGNEIGRLAQGMPDQVDGTDTMFLSMKIRYPKTEEEMLRTDESYATSEKAKQKKIEQY